MQSQFLLVEQYLRDQRFHHAYLKLRDIKDKSPEKDSLIAQLLDRLLTEATKPAIVIADSSRFSQLVKMLEDGDSKNSILEKHYKVLLKAMQTTPDDAQDTLCLLGEKAESLEKAIDVTNILHTSRQPQINETQTATQ